MNTDRQMLATQFAQAINQLGTLALLPQENEKVTSVQLCQWIDAAFEIKQQQEFLFAAVEIWAKENRANTIDEAGVDKE